MATPVLVTKLFVPRPRSERVRRYRLIDRLNQGLHRDLTLIAAPAGFGKTTLVSAWIEGIERPAAWLSLDDGDNDLTRFLLHLVAALQTIAADVGEGAMEALRSSPSPPTEAILSALVNDVTNLPENVVLVLDDYHLIDAEPVDHAVTFLLEHLPPQLHLVIVTREDPQLPLSRLRGRGNLTELRAADLRFTSAEAAQFLNQIMGLSLSAADIAALEDRTEGWIAGLQLAALSLQGHDDVSSFIRAFAGDHRYIVDYLVDEVLHRQSEDIRSFLLQTSILDRLIGPLCDAVTGQEGGTARLEALERGNFFVIPLDDQRQWYRYHHLFADMLHAHLKAEQPDRVPTLHQQASEWYERYGFAAEAISHALAAEDVERAAALIEQAARVMSQSRQEATLLGWLEALPDEVLRARPVLNVMYAGVLLLNGRLDGVEARLRDAERWLNTEGDRSTMVVMDDAEWRRLPELIAIYRAAIAQARVEVADVTRYAQRALDLASPDDDLVRGSAAGFLGLAAWTSGDLETGHRMYAECMRSILKIGYRSDALGCAIALADIRIAQGRLSDAMRTYEEALQLTAEQGVPPLRGTADMYVGMSELHREWNDLRAATQLLLQSKELGELGGLRQNPYRWCVSMALIREAEGDRDGALDLLAEAERLYQGDLFPNVRPIAALKARVWLAEGRVGEALRWAEMQGVTTEDDLSYLREFEHITLARVLLAQYESDRAERSIHDALRLLDRLLPAAEDGGRMGSAIQILVVLARAHAARGDTPAALASLERALTLAQPEGYIRLFVDEGAPMAHLLREAAARGIMSAYAGTLLAAFDGEHREPIEESPLPAPQPLIEPLSERELDVLRLLNSELTGPEIARELVVALSTVRTHTKSIYQKLDVTNRRAAVKRAAELNLI